MHFSVADTSYIHNLWPHTYLDVRKLQMEENLNHSVSFYSKHLMWLKRSFKNIKWSYICPRK